ncbi:hypothetical protein [Actinoallomurus acaciae]|uniref:Uncharacterized protein n=1 Tax=Actinoallomurus acaciae TaxID=502577 RepID=A0ABV5YR93_9ACTN
MSEHAERIQYGASDRAHVLDHVRTAGGRRGTAIVKGPPATMG